jgi:hypothetical protein
VAATFRDALALHRRRQYPLQFLLHERNAIGELMARELPEEQSAGKLPRCLNFTEFVGEMKKALRSNQAEEEHAWVTYFLPFWKDMVRLVSLELQCAENVHRLHRLDCLELIHLRVRIRAVQRSIRDLIEVGVPLVPAPTPRAAL